MSEYYQAPAVYHCGEKRKPYCNDTYYFSESMLRIIFGKLNGKCGNQLKLITVLMGVPGNGDYHLSQKWVMDMTGMDESGYKRARKALVKLGWISYDKDSIRVLFDKIWQSAADSPDTEHLSADTPPPHTSASIPTVNNKRQKDLIDLDTLVNTLDDCD